MGDGSASSTDALTAVVTPGATQERPQPDAPPFEPPERVDRYVLGEMLGAGGLGVVYEAWDPELERRVAVKLVRPKRPGVLKGSQRFLREAQALARLSHPNVVGVYGVGTCGDGETVYVVMEHIDGQTLRAWAEDGRRSTDEIVEVFLAAGRGIAAAHAAGIIHRDFKPDNVMVDREGRVRVLDFGLALVGGPGTVSAVEESFDSVPSESSFEDRLTQVGVVMGTPTYMAPEQHVGQPVGPATDQFSFCLALLSTLREGAPVFVGRSPRAMAAAKVQNQIQPRPVGDETPAWIEEAVLRGLEPEPDDRWPSMDALLEALVHEPKRRRRWVTVPLLGVVTLGVVVALRPESHDCADGADRLFRAWTEHREPATEAIQATWGPRSARHIARLEERFTTDVEAWQTAFVEACEGRASRSIDGLQFDRRMACLRARATERERVLTTLHDDSDAPRRVAELLIGLDPVTDCTDDAHLAAEVEKAPVPSDPALRAQVEEIREAIVRTDDLITDGAFEDAKRILDEQTGRARRIGFEPLFAELLYAQGRLVSGQSKTERAAELFEDALASAEGSGHDYVAAAIAGDLVFLYAKLRRLDDAERLFAHAKALVERVGSPDELRNKLASSAMALFSRQQRYEEALAAIEDAFPDGPPASDRGRLRYSMSLNNLALLHLRMGENRRAVALLTEALSLREDLLGADHPKLGTLHLNLSKAKARTGDFKGAEHHAQQATTLSAGYGETDFRVAQGLISLGVVRKKMGRYDEARADYNKALELLGKIDRPASEAMVLANLGNLEKRVGDLDAAMRYHAKALAMREAELGPDALDVAMSLGDLGSLHRRMKQFDKAKANYDRDLAIKRKALGDDHPKIIDARLRRANLALDMEDHALARAELDDAMRIVQLKRVNDTTAATSFNTLARLEHEEGHHEEAVKAAREAIERHTKLTGNPGLIGGARLLLAKALWALGRAGEARDALSAARVELRTEGKGVEEELAELEAIAESWSGPMPKTTAAAPG